MEGSTGVESDDSDGSDEATERLAWRLCAAEGGLVSVDGLRTLEDEVAERVALRERKAHRIRINRTALHAKGGARAVGLFDKVKANMRTREVVQNFTGAVSAKPPPMLKPELREQLSTTERVVVHRNRMERSSLWLAHKRQRQAQRVEAAASEREKDLVPETDDEGVRPAGDEPLCDDVEHDWRLLQAHALVRAHFGEAHFRLAELVPEARLAPADAAFLGAGDTVAALELALRGSYAVWCHIRSHFRGGLARLERIAFEVEVEEGMGQHQQHQKQQQQQRPSRSFLDLALRLAVQRYDWDVCDPSRPDVGLGVALEHTIHKVLKPLLLLDAEDFVSWGNHSQKPSYSSGRRGGSGRKQANITTNEQE